MAESKRKFQCFKLREDPGYPAMLDVRLESGDRYGLPYTYLIWIRFDPSVGILIRFSSYLVLINGRNLRELYEALLQHRVEWVLAENERFDVGEESDPFISKIEVREPDPKVKSSGQ